LFDAAVSEDLEHYPTDPGKPALLFMQLNVEDENHAAWPIVKNIVAKLEAAIDDYNGRDDSQTLTIDDVRQHFLRHVLEQNRTPLRTLTTTFVSFLLEWDFRSRLIDVSKAGSREPFYMHLFKGCLLFESLLKANPKKEVCKTAKLSTLVNQKLLKCLSIKKIETSSPSFDTIVQSLESSQPLKSAIQCTVKTRNMLAHNLVWVAESLNALSYDLLAKNISVSCLHAIACLYRSQDKERGRCEV
jgi:hypothetical protein